MRNCQEFQPGATFPRVADVQINLGDLHKESGKSGNPSDPSVKIAVGDMAEPFSALLGFQDTADPKLGKSVAMTNYTRYQTPKMLCVHAVSVIATGQIVFFFAEKSPIYWGTTFESSAFGKNVKSERRCPGPVGNLGE